MMENMIVRIDKLTSNTVRDQNRCLRQALQQAFLFIAHSEANCGKLTDDLQWDNNVRAFIAGPISQIDIGRSYMPKAVLEIDKIKELLNMPEPDNDKERSFVSALLSLNQDDISEIATSDPDTRTHIIARLSSLVDTLSAKADKCT